MRTARVLLVAAVAAVAAASLLVAIPANANTKSFGDPNDVAGKLDVKSIGQSHASTGTALIHSVTTYTSWTAGDLNATNRYFVFGFNTDTDKTLERLVYIVRQSGKLKGLLANESVQAIGTVPVTKTSATSVRFTITRAQLANPAGYKWAVASFWKDAGSCSAGSGCVDSAPNTGFLNHDLTAPTIDSTKVDFISCYYTLKDTSQWQVSVTDTGGAGMGTWKIQGRPQGTTAAFQTLKQGTGDLNDTVVPVEQGVAYDLRLLATDREGNRSTSRIENTVGVVDDANTSKITYSAGWAAANPSSTEDCDKTLHSSSTEGETATFTFQGSHVAWHGYVSSSPDGEATVAIDDGASQLVKFAAKSFGHRQLIFAKSNLGAGQHTLVITVTSGNVNIDFLWSDNS